MGILSENIDYKKNQNQTNKNIEPKSIWLKHIIFQNDKYLYLHNACPRSSDPVYIVNYYKKWVTNSWTRSILCS